MLKGTLDDFTLPDIFQLLSRSGKTGRLDVQRSAGQGSVYFRDGDVYFAESTLSKELIGQKLVRSKVLTDGQLMKALDEQAESGGRLGEVLLAGGLVSEDQLETAVRSQIEDAVFDLLRWEAGEFDWAPGETVEAEVPLSVSVENLIMEGSRRLNELAIITRKIPSENAIVEMAPTPPEGAAEINITPDEWRILVLVNGQRSVLDIAETVSSDIFATMRTLYGLAAAGLVHVPGHVDEDESPLPPLPTEQAPVADTAQPEPAEDPADEAVAASPAIEEPVAEVFTEAPTNEAVAEDLASEEVAATDNGVMASLEALDISDLVESTPEPDVSYHASAYEPDEIEVMDVDDFAGAGDPTTPAAEASDDESSEDDSTLEATDLPTGDWFDAPQPGDLVEEVPEPDPVASFEETATDDSGADADPFVSEILGPEKTEEASAVAEDLHDQLLNATATEAPDPQGYQGTETVDKRAAVQELSELFKQSEVENRPTFLVPSATTQPEEQEEDFIAGPEPESRHRVEDDEEITRGLISRLIDGVKGL